MPQMSVLIDGGWADIPYIEREGNLVNLTGNNAPYIEVASIALGMRSGAESVILRTDLPDGKTLVMETSLKLFLAAADAMRAAHRPGGAGDVN